MTDYYVSKSITYEYVFDVSLVTQDKLADLIDEVVSFSEGYGLSCCVEDVCNTLFVSLGNPEEYFTKFFVDFFVDKVNKIIESFSVKQAPDRHVLSALLSLLEDYESPTDKNSLLEDLEEELQEEFNSRDDKLRIFSLKDYI